MNLWLFDIEQFPESKMELAYSCLPNTMVDSIVRYRLLDDRKSRLIARLMIQKYVEEKVGSFDWANWDTAPNGKPYLENGPFFTISHSGKKVAVAFSTDTEIGVDIEKITDVKIETLSMYFHSDEIAYLKRENFDPQLFFQIWSRKEAFLKTVGIGLLEGLNQFSVLEPLEYKGKRVYLKDFKTVEGYSFSIGSTIEEISVDPLEIELDALIYFIEEKSNPG